MIHKRYYHSTCERISGWCVEQADKSDSGDVVAKNENKMVVDQEMCMSRKLQEQMTDACATAMDGGDWKVRQC